MKPILDDLVSIFKDQPPDDYMPKPMSNVKSPPPKRQRVTSSGMGDTVKVLFPKEPTGGGGEPTGGRGESKRGGGSRLHMFTKLRL